MPRDGVAHSRGGGEARRDAVAGSQRDRLGAARCGREEGERADEWGSIGGEKERERRWNGAGPTGLLGWLARGARVQ